MLRFDINIFVDSKFSNAHSQAYRQSSKFLNILYNNYNRKTYKIKVFNYNYIYRCFWVW